MEIICLLTLSALCLCRTMGYEMLKDFLEESVDPGFSAGENGSKMNVSDR